MDNTSTRGIWPWLGLAALLVAADQVTKLLILANYQLGESTFITSFFNIVRVHNPGAAFSFLADAGGWQRWFFTGVGVAASVFIVWMLRTHPGEKLFAFALACILGGAIGNVIDRVLYGYVVDWLDFHWGFLSGLFPGGHFPAFNIADAAITVGAVSLILDEILRWRRSR
ncbi:MAG: signal peptidase II [Hydrogenophaga sp.]|jgi:signal peptidase II|uniref:signal peptidase II n=1 Tax=Hydrogenophaga sp. TaxID=1904254 RepID=UPI0025BAE066|nr:signal peptidase II [Hydrogenophaga sp.]MDO9135126.1 signal peptidase II [Hydrogenophaga sp.]MDO9504666.1 signal peptidase II [Hydrogenophaga sp.]MDP2251541.1 signal peptidase II [Hydrogenophaga sp.]MDP2988014.1 signal peptidase II [Hydrogenophaga sp.]MDP3203689.1 signal peptidase II [Hydrogenophaga sp.]